MQDEDWTLLDCGSGLALWFKLRLVVGEVVRCHVFTVWLWTLCYEWSSSVASFASRLLVQ